MKATHKMSGKETEEFLNNRRWEDIRFDVLGVNYDRIISLTGCREYVYGEDPDAYLALVFECYDKYCEVYPDEAELRDRRRKGISALHPDDFGKFLDEMKDRKKPLGEMDKVRMEAKEEDNRRTVEIRKTAFRKECEKLGLRKFF